MFVLYVKKEMKILIKMLTDYIHDLNILSIEYHKKSTSYKIQSNLKKGFKY
jgi:hypothetical protein